MHNQDVNEDQAAIEETGKLALHRKTRQFCRHGQGGEDGTQPRSGGEILGDNARLIRGITLNEPILQSRSWFTHPDTMTKVKTNPSHRDTIV